MKSLPQSKETTQRVVHASQEGCETVLQSNEAYIQREVLSDATTHNSHCFAQHVAFLYLLLQCKHGAQSAGVRKSWEPGIGGGGMVRAIERMVDQGVIADRCTCFTQ